MRNFANQ